MHVNYVLSKVVRTDDVFHFVVDGNARRRPDKHSLVIDSVDGTRPLHLHGPAENWLRSVGRLTRAHPITAARRLVALDVFIALDDREQTKGSGRAFDVDFDVLRPRRKLDRVRAAGVVEIRLVVKLRPVNDHLFDLSVAGKYEIVGEQS